MQGEHDAVLLTMQGVGKRFGGVVALDGVDLSVRRGEVHALVGENGAGKSTLMKVLSGAHRPDAGTMRLDGAPYAPAGPQDARRAGVAMIYQELNLALDLTVEQNVMLGREESRFGVVRARAMRPRVVDALALLDPALRPDTRVADLGPGARQLIEIARALALDARLLVMDEPTSSLSAEEAEALFRAIERLRGRDVSIIYISHFLEEIQRIADRFTVLRDGRTAGGGAVAGTSNEEIVERMVGRRLEEVYPERPAAPATRGEVALEVRGLRGAPLPAEASLELRRGEIFGVAGIVGAGRTELLRTIFGLDAVRAGEVRVASLSLRHPTPRLSLSRGVGLLSEDRKEEGLALSLSIATNLTLSRLAPYVRRGVLSPGGMRAASVRWAGELAIRCDDPDQPVGTLSGGNQQKVAIARLLHHDVDVLLLDEPTRGIDVGSKVQVYRLLAGLAAAGKALLVVSSYLPELLGICDRIGVMYRGELRVARDTVDWTERDLLQVATTGEL
ncbi:MAG: sugar ABC transporter ATP-binding protein [Planctomycetota bacterium]